MQTTSHSSGIYTSLLFVSWFPMLLDHYITSCSENDKDIPRLPQSDLQIHLTCCHHPLQLMHNYLLLFPSIYPLHDKLLLNVVFHLKAFWALWFDNKLTYNATLIACFVSSSTVFISLNVSRPVASVTPVLFVFSIRCPVFGSTSLFPFLLSPFLFSHV